MTRFVREAIARAGLADVIAARRAGDLDVVRSTVDRWRTADLLALGAAADAVRADEVGDVVRIHDRAASLEVGDVRWLGDAPAETALDVLREVAVLRLASGFGARIGFDWTARGLEVAQVALGFGASELAGPITRKSGLPILASETKRVKGLGQVGLLSIQKQEIVRLVSCAGRRPVFVGVSDAAPVAVSEEVGGA